jgi:2-octaprenyl-6-methoxyphenol hydroxylase
MRDVVIVGGGPVGSALALGLSQAGLRATLLEARTRETDDRRSLALSFGSRLILQRLGVWQHLQDPTPIECIHVSQRGAPGRALLTAKEAGLPALGYVVAYADLQRTLSGATERADRIQLLRGARATGVDGNGQVVAVGYTLDGVAQQLQARLAAIADGGMLTQAEPSQRERSYAQSALVAFVRTDRPHRGLAFERFTPDGPVALLPFREGYSLVWTATPDAASRLMNSGEAALLAQLQETFGDRAGRFASIESLASFPLGLKVAAAPSTPRTVRLGNAAQTLHPVAGQGFNLGLRDAWTLAQAAARAPDAIGEAAFINDYLRSRRVDRGAAVMLTDALVRLFSNRSQVLGMLRAGGLVALDSTPSLKRGFMGRMMFGS